MKALQQFRASIRDAIRGIANVIRQQEHMAPIEQNLVAEQRRLQEITERYAQQTGANPDVVARLFTRWRFINNIPQKEAIERAENDDAGWTAYLQEGLAEDKP